MIRRESILAQAAVLIAIGLLIGAVDAFALRPVRLEMAKSNINDFLPPTPPAQADAPKPAAGSDAKPADAPVSTNQTSKPADAPQTAAAPTDAAPKPAPEPVKPAPSASGHAAPENSVTIEQAFGLYQKVPMGEAFFVDARTFDKYEVGHVAEAIPMNLKSFDGARPAQLNLMDPSKPIVVYCGGGDCDESKAVALNLNNFGFQHVFIMHDGFPAWQSAGHPVGTGPHPLHDAAGFK